jgi:hypothetical protein
LIVEKRAELAGKLAFRYPVAALVGVGALAVILGALAWVNDNRADAELEQVASKLCSSGELASEVSVNDDTNAAKWQAWAIVDALLGDVGGEKRWDVRVLQQQNGGWKQWNRWSTDPAWVHDTELDEVARNNKCAGSVKNGTVRVVRPLHTRLGIPSLILVERTRQ